MSRPEALVSALKAHQSVVASLHDNTIPVFEQYFNGLCLLQKGWYDGVQGEPVDLYSLTHARSFLRNLHKKHPELPLPDISPVVDGDVVTLSWPGDGHRQLPMSRSLDFFNDRDVTYITSDSAMLLNLDKDYDLIMSKILTQNGE